MRGGVAAVLCLLAVGADALHFTHVSECGKSRGCWRFPAGCTADCEFIATWKYHEEQINIEMEAPVAKKAAANGEWLALGISADENMGNDTVFECVFPSTDASSVYLSHNTPTNNFRMLEATSKLLYNTYTEKMEERLKCGADWRLNLNGLSGQERSILLNLQTGVYRLMFARGEIDQDGAKHSHDFDVLPRVSSSTLRFCANCAEAAVVVA